MYRKVFQTFLSVAFRPGVNVYTHEKVPRLHFHLMRNVLLSKSPSFTAATEDRTDFSDLSSEEFGTLRSQKRSTQEKMEQLPEEEDERIEYDVTNAEGRKNRRPKEYYEKLIEKLLAEKRMVEALDVLETRILKKDRIYPWYRVYNLLINGCAKVGYCDKAFALYHSMKERNVKPTAATYTGLFNAIANSPFPEDAEKKLIRVRKILAENGVELSTINYHAMIKSYARLKDTYSAFLVADEMLSKGHAFTDDTCCFLFQACISDTEAGLRHALLLWHKMRSRKITPSAHAYNLFFRCIRDCGFGTEKDLQDVLKQISVGKREENEQLGPSSWSKRISWKKKSKEAKKQSSSEVQQETNSEQTETEPADVLVVHCEPNETEITDDIREDELEEIGVVRTDISSEMKSEQTEPEIMENKPNLLAANPHLGSIMTVKDVKTASDRLLLLGGINTILEQMEYDGVKPNIKSFTILLDIIPATDFAEELLLKEMKNQDVFADIDFYNMLIKKRAMRGDYEKAREVLSLIQANYLQPDIVTFGVLALSCSRMQEAEELVYQLRDFGYRLNMPILGAMLLKACYHFNFDYLLFVMKTTQKIKINVSEEYLKILDDFNTKVTAILKRKKQGDKTLRQFFYQPSFFENYKMWKAYYQRFKKEVNLEIPQHPYKQFQKTNDVAETVKDQSEFTEREDFHKSDNYRRGFRRKSKLIRQEDEEASDVAEMDESNFRSARKDNDFDFYEKRPRQPQSMCRKRNSAESENNSKFVHQDDEGTNNVEVDESKVKHAEKDDEFDFYEKQQTNRRGRKPQTISWRRNSVEFKEKSKFIQDDEEATNDEMDESNFKSAGKNNGFDFYEKRQMNRRGRKTQKEGWRRKMAEPE